MSRAEEEFLKAFAEIKPVEYVEEYRAYYDEHNNVRFFMANVFPENDLNWITITREEYIKQDYQWQRVIDGKLVKQIPNHTHRFSLTHSNKGVKVVKYHASIVVEPDETYPDIEYYDNRTD